MENTAKIMEITNHINECMITLPLFQNAIEGHDDTLIRMMANDYY